MNLEQFDTILYFDGSEQDIFEGGVDPRNYNSKLPVGSDKPIKGQYVNYIDPKLYANWSFGNQLKRDVQSLGNNYSCEVSDFGQEIVIRVTHNDVVSGRTASKTFLIIFTNTKGEAYIKSHSNKWRSVSGLGQAASYIKSICSNLTSATQQKM